MKRRDMGWNCWEVVPQDRAFARHSPGSHKAGSAKCQRYDKVNFASFVYFDPFGESWLWYRKNSRGVMLPNSGLGRADSFSCRCWNVSLGASRFCRRGEPDDPGLRAKVKCGLNFLSSLAMPSG